MGRLCDADRQCVMFGFSAIEGAVIIAPVHVAIIFYPRCL